MTQTRSEMYRAWLSARGLVVLAFAVGVVVRIGPVLAHDWPLHDGGLFYEMIGEIIRAGLRIPAYTAYDHAGIPFAYPPLALWLAAAVETLTRLSRPEIMRLLPVLFSLAELVAFYLLAREVLPRRAYRAVALLAFAVEPFAYEVHITGGGLTRSLGMLFAILAVWQGLRMLRGGGVRAMVATALLAGLGALSHPEAGVFVAVALGVAWLVERRTVPALGRLVVAAVAAVAVAAPWWLGVLLTHGAGPLLAAFTGTQHDLVASIVTFVFMYLLQGPLPIVGLLALLGEIHLLLARRPFLVLWLVALCLADLRYSPVAGAVPLSLLAAIGLIDVVLPAARSASDRMARKASGSATRWPRLVIGGIVALIVAVGLVQNSAWYGRGVALDADDREAMAWVASNQPAGQAFVVLGGPEWGSDDTAEWFPALADRTSLTTSQGLEWVPGGAHTREQRSEDALRACQADVASGCLAGWVATYAAPKGDWAIYVAADGSSFADSTPANAAARAWIRSDPGLRVIYDGPGAVIAVPVGIEAELTTPMR